MSKKIFFVGVMLVMSLGTMAQSDKAQSNNENNIDNKYYYWKNEIFGEMPEIQVTPGGIFDDPADLLTIVAQISKANEQGMNHAQFFQFTNDLNQYIVDHPKYIKNAYMHLGHLNNAVNPSSLRNRQRALSYYQQVANGVNSQIDKAQLYLLMASCYNLGGGKCNINRMSNYYTEATKSDPRFASYLGDLYLYGWGTYRDLNLAAHLYTIAMIYGDRNAINKLRVVQFISQVKHPSAKDSAGFNAYEQYAYMSRIGGEMDKAFSYIQNAAQKDWVPAFYSLANIINKELPQQYDKEEIQQEVFKWLRKGADKQYVPCMTALAIFAYESMCDTAKGPIFKTDNKGNFNDRDRKIVAQQSFDLLNEAASLGNSQAMIELAIRYEQGNEFNIPKKDIKKALFYYKVANNCGSKYCRERIEILSNKIGNSINESTRQSIDEEADKLVVDISLKIQEIFRNIKSNSMLRTPTISQNSYSLSNNDDDINENDPLYGANLAFGYELAYDLYEDYMIEMSHYSNGYRDLNGELYQNLMRNLRQMALNLPIPKEIKQSNWETWVGN